jgi:formiminotetrahydrofolate cyclodeaminase
VLADLSLTALLEELAAAREAPGSGSALAAALALAAATVQMAARLSADVWPEAGGIAAQAETLRERAAALVDEDAEVYARALDARAARAEDVQARRDWALGRATASALEPPLALVRAAADLAELCREAVTRVEPQVQADVGAAAALAAGVARGARELVAVNLTALPDDPRIAEADRLVALAWEIAAETGP